MKKSKFSESEIFAILNEGESGVPVAELCLRHGMLSVTYYAWRSKYGGMDSSAMAEFRETKSELQRLKGMYADLAMQNALIKEALGKK